MAGGARGAVKKEALRKAGIGYHEVVAGHTTAGELKRLVEKLVPGVRIKGVIAPSPQFQSQARATPPPKLSISQNRHTLLRRDTVICAECLECLKLMQS